MSDRALSIRSRRRVAAAPDGRHDRLIGLLRVGLPMGVGVLAAFLVMAPLTNTGDVSFVLNKDKVEVAHERLKLQAARYRGSDARGQPFTLDAASAVQRSSAEPVVQLQGLAASLRMKDGPATLTANRGRYDMDGQVMAVDGPVAFRGPDDYRLDTHDARVDLRTRRLTGTGAVTGTVRQGDFSADRMTADLDGRVVRLEGHARLRIAPGRNR